MFFISFPILSYPILPQVTTSIGYTKPYPEPSQSNLLSSWYLMVQTNYLSKSWVFKSRFPFKVRQYGQQQFYLQNKVCWILSKMVGAPSFLHIQPMLQSPPKHSSSTSVNFYIPIPPLIFHKIILTIPTNPLTLPSAIPLRVFTSLFLHITKNIFATLTISPIQSASRNQGARKSCDEWQCFNLPLLPQSMNSDNTAHSQSQKKISILIYILI